MEMQERILSKVEVIREDQVRAIETLKEIRHLVRSPPPASSPATTALPLAKRVENWVLSPKPIVMGAVATARHVVAIVTVWYLLKSGQAEAADPYIRWLLGM